MPGLISGLKADAQRAARNAAFSAAFAIIGFILLIFGLVCLSAALWWVIATYHGAIIAFALLGLIYLALGGLFLALATRRSRHGRPRPVDPVPPPKPREPLVQIAEGFAIGMQAGRAARGPRR